MIVLDTNVVSELMRPSPATAVVAWLGQQARGSLTTTAVTVAEIGFGLARLPAGRRATQLQQVAVDVLAAFPAQVLAFDAAAAALYGESPQHESAPGTPSTLSTHRSLPSVVLARRRLRRATRRISSTPVSNCSIPGKHDATSIRRP